MSNEIIKVKISESNIYCKTVEEIIVCKIFGLKGPKGDIGPTGPAGTTNHAELINLDYDSSEHTGFQKKLNYVSEYHAYEVE